MTYGLRGAAPDLVCGDHSHICRSRGEVLRRFECGWFRGFVSEGKRGEVRVRPSRTGHGAHHETRGVDSKASAAPVRQDIKCPGARRQRQNHETTRAGRIVVLCTANGRCPNAH